MGVERIPEAEAAAIERFVINATVPLFCKRGNSVIPHGTGTLFSLNNRYFLITARHIFDAMDPSQLAYPETTREAKQIFPFRALMTCKPEDPRFDVAVLEIQDTPTIERFLTGWRFLSRDNVALPSSSGTFFLSGYPVSLTRNGPNWFRGELLTFYTSRILEIPDKADEPVDKGLDLFFDYGESARNLHGVTIETPPLQGASGGSIWEYDRYDIHDLWTPENTIKIVGVQCTYRDGEYFRASSWRVVARCLKLIDSALTLML